MKPRRLGTYTRAGEGGDSGRVQTARAIFDISVSCEPSFALWGCCWPYALLKGVAWAGATGDSTRLLSAARDSTVTLWDVQSGRDLYTYAFSGYGIPREMGLPVAHSDLPFRFRCWVGGEQAAAVGVVGRGGGAVRERLRGLRQGPLLPPGEGLRLQGADWGLQGGA
jgi:hypothetical protein